MNDNLRCLSDAGVAIWRDDLSPQGVRGGELAQAQNVVGLTVSSAVLHKAVSSGAVYGEELHELAVGQVSVDNALRAITATYAREAADALRPVYDTTDGADGRVTIEVDPRLAHDTGAIVAEAEQLWSLVARPNLQVAIPATAAGLRAVTATLASGISVNAVLIFSPTHFRAVLEAFLSGLERAGTDGRPVSATACFSLSDIDTEVDKRLWKIGTDGSAALRGKAALANARLAHAAYENVLRGERWKALAAANARRPRLAWTSTRVKDPYYLETRYVDDLVVNGVVSILSEVTFNAVTEYSEIRGDTIHGTYEDAYHAVAALTEIGIDHDDVFRVLEEKGLDKLVASWQSLLCAVESGLCQPAS